MTTSGNPSNNMVVVNSLLFIMTFIAMIMPNLFRFFGYITPYYNSIGIFNGRNTVASYNKNCVYGEKAKADTYFFRNNRYERNNNNRYERNNNNNNGSWEAYQNLLLPNDLLTSPRDNPNNPRNENGNNEPTNNSEANNNEEEERQRLANLQQAEREKQKKVDTIEKAKEMNREYCLVTKGLSGLTLILLFSRIMSCAIPFKSLKMKKIESKILAVLTMLTIIALLTIVVLYWLNIKKIIKLNEGIVLQKYTYFGDANGVIPDISAFLLYFIGLVACGTCVGTLIN